MTAIPVTAANIREANPHQRAVRSFKAVEVITAGDPVCFDLTAGTTAGAGVYNIDISDTDRRNAIGIALRTVAIGEQVPVAMLGSIVTGYDFSPSDTATHRNGVQVYTADSGLDDAQAEGAIPIGYIIPVGETQGLFIQPQYTVVGTA